MGEAIHCPGARKNLQPGLCATMKLRIVIALLMLLAVTTGFYQLRQITALQNSITAINTSQLAAQKANAATEPGSANIDPEEWVQLRADKLALMKMRSEISELRRFTNVSPEQAQQQLKQTRSELASA